MDWNCVRLSEAQDRGSPWTGVEEDISGARFKRKKKRTAGEEHPDSDHYICDSVWLYSKQN